MDTATTTKTARYGACSACRRSKVKCLPRFEDTSSCRRCAELDETCEFEPHRKGRRHIHAKRKRSEEPVRVIAASSVSGRRDALNLVPPMVTPSETQRPTTDGQQWPPVRSSPYVVIHSMTGPRDWFVTSSRSIYAVPCPDQLASHDPIVRGVMTTKDSERLFKRYTQSVARWSISLDPSLQSPDITRLKSTFQFTAICAVSAIFCPLSRSIALPLRLLVNELANQILLGGFKSLEIVHGFQLLANYLPYPASGVGDRSWFYTGVAMRMLIELGGHCPRAQVGVIGDAEVRGDRMQFRAYVASYLHDMSISTQLGRPRFFRFDHGISDRAMVWVSDPLNTVDDSRLAAVLTLRLIWEACESRPPTTTDHELNMWLERWGSSLSPYEHFLHLHVRLLLALTAVSVSEIGQAEEEQSKAIYEAASLGVTAAIEGLSDGGVLRSASNLGVIMILYPAVILLKMIQISDPECLASETNRDMDALRELSGAILLAAACRNDEESTMHQYGSLLDEIVGAEVPWHGGEDSGDGTGLSASLVESSHVDQFSEIMGYFSLDSSASFI